MGGTYRNKKSKGNASCDGTDDKDEEDVEDGKDKRDEHDRDGLYIPQGVLDPLTPKFRAMLYMGHDAMRKQNQNGKKRMT